MEDYSTLASLVLNEIRSNPSLVKELIQVQKLIKTRRIRYKDAVRFSEKLGTEASKLIKQIIGDGSTLELDEFADKFIAPVYTALQNTTLGVAKNVQQVLNEQNGLNFNPAYIKADASRVQHIVARYREAESFDTVSFLLGDDVIENITRSAVSDTLRGNADLQEKAGFEVYLTRTDGSGCCDWCASMTGTYKKGDEPSDFWRVHKGCSCEFDYKSSISGTHSKISFSTDSEGKLTKNTK